MKYMLTLIDEEPGGWEDATPEQMQAEMKAWDEYTAALRDADAFVAGEGLAPAASATTVRLGDEPVVTDGPFAETKEQLGGFYLIDVDDQDAAVAWAHKVPMQGGAVEVRAVVDYDLAESTEHSVGDGAPS